MTTDQSAAIPRLVVLAPESFRGRQIEIVADYTTVGREATCDVRLDDPHVSRTHAALQRRGGAVYVQDLGSSGGTFVNGNPAAGAPLRQGDVVTFAVVQARFEAAAPVAAETQAMPTQVAAPAAAPPQARAVPPPPREVPLPQAREVPPPQAREVPPPQAQAMLPPMQMAPPAREAPPPRPQAHAVSPPEGMAGPARERPEPNPTEVRRPEPVRYDIGQQHGQVISNVGRDQYNAHVQQVIHQRESFLREVARTKTKARWLVWLGLLLFVAGFAVFAAADVNFLKQIANDLRNNGNTAPPTDPFGRPIDGIPSGLLGWAIAAVGALMLMIGIVLHIVATSRRRRVEREHPMPMPWPPGGPGG